MGWGQNNQNIMKILTYNFPKFKKHWFGVETIISVLHFLLSARVAAAALQTHFSMTTNTATSIFTNTNIQYLQIRPLWLLKIQKVHRNTNFYVMLIYMLMCLMFSIFTSWMIYFLCLCLYAPGSTLVNGTTESSFLCICICIGLFCVFIIYLFLYFYLFVPSTLLSGATQSPI